MSAMNKYAERLGNLRALMEDKGWDAVVLTGSDPHASEYPAPRWKQVEWLTGFSGECGDVVVTKDHAGLWTDTRYFIQAGIVLPGTGYELHKTRIPGAVPIPQWLAEDAFHGEEGGVVIAVDSASESLGFVDAIKKAFSDVGQECEIASAPDLIDSLWTDRPSIPVTPVITLGDDLTGESRRSKIDWLLASISEAGCGTIVLTALDEIAWLLNARGSDIEYNPYIISYLIVNSQRTCWCVRKDSFRQPDEESRYSFDEIKKDGIEIREYDDVGIIIEELYSDGMLGKVAVDPKTVNYGLYSTLDSCSRGNVVLRPSPVPLRKAVKNEVEIEGMKEAHLQDGIAMEKFLYWLDRQMDGGYSVSERDAADKLGELRSRIEGYMGDSFKTISAYGPGAALPHYVTPDTDAPMLEAHGLYLCDSGGQYMYGTTDITRTVPLGPCTSLEKEDYTIALKGHIGLEMVIFPYGTAGCQIDLAARYPLWLAKRDFGHGTGHGVGFFLGVHEGPQEIRHDFNQVPFEPGMITSDEPGIYREGLYGVRHENLLLCVDSGASDFGRWLGFEPLTLCHFDTSAIVPSLLTSGERDWVNAYNDKVFRTLAPHLPAQIATWLKAKTDEI
jgi:Xaa-Pro aminopeptidase